MLAMLSSPAHCTVRDGKNRKSEQNLRDKDNQGLFGPWLHLLYKGFAEFKGAIRSHLPIHWKCLRPITPTGNHPRHAPR
jgi:hypothetical protein